MLVAFSMLSLVGMVALAIFTIATEWANQRIEEATDDLADAMDGEA